MAHGVQHSKYRRDDALQFHGMESKGVRFWSLGISILLLKPASAKLYVVMYVCSYKKAVTGKEV